MKHKGRQWRCAWIALAVVLSGERGMAAPPDAVRPPPPMKLFLLIGQSNMAGRGAVEEQDRIVHPRVFMLTKDLAWAPAIDPLHFDKPRLAGVGLGSAFARVIADRHPEWRVGLIPAAFGGTSLDQWSAAGELYANAVSRTREAMKSGALAGILWHQGESEETPELVSTYADRFAALIAQLRRDLEAPGVPVVVGELGRFRTPVADLNPVLAQLPRRIPRCGLATAEGLTDKGDGAHFDARSLRELGRRYAVVWSAVDAPATPARR